MNDTPSRGTLAVAMVGHAFMGAAHSQAWRTAPRFFDLPLHPTMSVVCGRDTGRAAEAAQRLDQALAMSPADPALLQERAEVALLLGDLDLAERLARQGAGLGA